jgi:hypothetical protein
MTRLADKVHQQIPLIFSRPGQPSGLNKFFNITFEPPSLPRGNK